LKWFKHIVDSGDDPDVDDAITIFGTDGYYVFFRTLEVMSREFNVNNPGKNTFSVEFLRKKYRVSWGKVVKILSFYQEKERIFYKLFQDNHLPSIGLNCPKLQEISDEYTQKNIKKTSGQTPDTCRDKVTIEEEREEERDKDKRIKKEAEASLPTQIKKEKPQKTKYLDSVFLTDEQYKKLQEAIGQKSLDAAIEKLDYSISVKGGKYRDHYKAILNWQKRGFLNGNTGIRNTGTYRQSIRSERDAINQAAGDEADAIRREYEANHATADGAGKANT